MYKVLPFARPGIWPFSLYYAAFSKRVIQNSKKYSKKFLSIFDEINLVHAQLTKLIIFFLC
jgi:hypothetical protein